MAKPPLENSHYTLIDSNGNVSTYYSYNSSYDTTTLVNFALSDTVCIDSLGKTPVSMTYSSSTEEATITYSDGTTATRSKSLGCLVSFDGAPNFIYKENGVFLSCGAW